MKVDFIWFTISKGENVLAKAEEWNPVLSMSGGIYSVLCILVFHRKMVYLNYRMRSFANIPLKIINPLAFFFKQ